jgi:hypothetical protein
VSWIDPVFAALVGTLTAFGAARRLTGLWVGIGGVLLLRPLLGVAASTPIVGLIAALLGGLLLGLLGRNLLAGLRTGRWWQRALGGLGGATLGVALVLALATSLPIQRSPFDPNQLYYPPRDLPALVQGAALRSWTLSFGRDVLLYPLLDAQGAVPEGRDTLLRGLHRWLVVGEPWREGGAGS